MNLQDIPRAVWLIAAALLLIGIAKLPYGYYQFLRIETTIVAAFFAYTAFTTAKAVGFWTLLFAAVAILFNPIIPIYLSKDAWMVIDGVVAVFILAHLVIARGKLFSKASSKDR